MIVKDPNNFALNYNYAVEIYNLLYNKNKGNSTNPYNKKKIMVTG